MERIKHCWKGLNTVGKGYILLERTLLQIVTHCMLDTLHTVVNCYALYVGNGYTPYEKVKHLCIGLCTIRKMAEILTIDG